MKVRKMSNRVLPVKMTRKDLPKTLAGLARLKTKQLGTV